MGLNPKAPPYSGHYQLDLGGFTWGTRACAGASGSKPHPSPGITSHHDDQDQDRGELRQLHHGQTRGRARGLRRGRCCWIPPGMSVRPPGKTSSSSRTASSRPRPLTSILPGITRTARSTAGPGYGPDREGWRSPGTSSIWRTRPFSRDRGGNHPRPEVDGRIIGPGHPAPSPEDQEIYFGWSRARMSATSNG